MELPGLTHAELLRRLQREIDECGSKAQAARSWSISPQLLDFVLKGQRNIGPKLLTALGLKRTTIVIHRYAPAETAATEIVSKVAGRPMARGGDRRDPE